MCVCVVCSVGGAVWNNILPEKLEMYLPEQPKAKALVIYKSIVVAQEFAKGSVAREAIDRAYRETQRLLAIAATAALAPMVGVMFALKDVDLGKEHEDESREAKDETACDEVGRGGAVQSSLEMEHQT